MTTADWALIISIFSACLSLAGFVWNVWSKFIFPKAKVRTTFSVMNIVPIEEEHRMSPAFLNLSATNYGPGAVTLYAAVARPRVAPRWIRRLFKMKQTYALLNPLDNFPTDMHTVSGPFGGGLPRKIEVGESFSLKFVFPHPGLLERKFVDVGFNDTFGRYHWAPRRQVREVVAQIREELSTA